MNHPNLTMTSGSILGRASLNSEEAKTAPQSQIDGLLFEQDCLLSKLSDEIYTAEGRFSLVLIPQPPTSEQASTAGEPMPAMSSLGWSTHERNNRIRAMLALLRSINERSTVAP